jgi:transcription antitermination protein NusB
MSTMVGPRRRAREVALQILIQMDVNPELGAEQAMRLYFDHLAADAASDEDDGDGRGDLVRPAPPFDRPMVQALVSGVATRRAELDQIVQDLSRNWRLERMALVERNVIRLALYELKHARDVPTNVALDEAVELTKKFGTSEGAAFVNGLLDRAATELSLRH